MTRPLRVELIYGSQCPHVDMAREMIQAALAEMSAEAIWVEWNCDDPRTPTELRHYGSPTVLVNGRDVSNIDIDDTRPDGSSCRIYPSEDADHPVCGAPSAALIARAIRARNIT